MAPSQTWVGITAIIAFAFCVSLYFFLHFREKREKLNTIRQAIQLSNASDPETLSAWVSAASDTQSDLWRALSDVGLGVGFLAAGGVLHFNETTNDAAAWPVALGCIILFLGCGRLLAYYLQQKRPR